MRTVILCFSILAGVLAGCGTTATEMQIKSQSERSDVFTEIKPGEPVQEGFAALSITASIKTPLAGYYILESQKSLHGRTGYPFLFNIDGQAAFWRADGFDDSRPAYDEDGGPSHDPEARQGMKYILTKRLRLRAGEHQVFFGLPEENYFVEVEIVLKGGEASVLEYKPIYRYETFPIRIPTFLKGIASYEIFLNGKQML